MEQRSLAPAWLSFDKKPPSGRPRATRPGHASSTNTSSRPSAASWSQRSTSRSSNTSYTPRSATMPLSQPIAAPNRSHRVVVATLPSARSRTSESSTTRSMPSGTPSGGPAASASAWRLPTPPSDSASTPKHTSTTATSSTSLSRGRGVANLGWATSGSKSVRRPREPAPASKPNPSPCVQPAKDTPSDGNIKLAVEAAVEVRQTQGSGSNLASPDSSSSTPTMDPASPLVALTKPIAIKCSPPAGADADEISQSLEAETRFLRNLGWEGAAVPEEDDDGLTTAEIAAFKQTADSSHGLSTKATGSDSHLDPLARLTTAVLNEDDDDDSDESDDDDNEL
eukprot:m.58734 g.58734  ORF g.58734 m.58734 type:complete len:339 (+) comp13787_c0_seq2:183-1199(+)